MSYRLIIHDDAYEDIRQIILWYNDQEDKLGQEFVTASEELLDRLCQNPFLWQIRRKNVRFALFKRFPYKIVFEISKQDVIVYAVLHAHRHPKKAYRRAKRR